MSIHYPQILHFFFLPLTYITHPLSLHVFSFTDRCVDVYTEVLPAAGPMFASKGRVLGNVGVGYVSDLVARLREQGEMTLAAAVAANAKFTSSSNASAPVKFIRINDDSSMTRRTEQIVTPRVDAGEWTATLGLSGKIMEKVPALKKVPSALSSLRPYLTLNPGMNLTFVIEGIMSSTSGLRPFDMETFRKNDAKQPLRAVSSTVRGGKMETVAFGSQEGDYWDLWVEEYKQGPETNTESRIKRTTKAVRRLLSSLAGIFMKSIRKTRNVGRRLLGKDIVVPPKLEATETETSTDGFRTPKETKQVREATACPDNSGKKGLFACLESSMLVPGAAGPPLKLLRSKHRKEADETGAANNTNISFDAFACEYFGFAYYSAVSCMDGKGRLTVCNFIFICFHLSPQMNQFPIGRQLRTALLTCLPFVLAPMAVPWRPSRTLMKNWWRLSIFASMVSRMWLTTFSKVARNIAMWKTC